LKFLRLLLFPFSILYGAILAIRRKAYQKGFLPSQAFDLPIISVGNISTGGTGKTPFSELLIRKFLAKGLKVVYLSRGYGRETKGFKWVRQDIHDVRLFGDEATQISLKFPEVPVAVCENRVAGMQKMLADKSGNIDLVILDDAFQHLRIQRNMDIIMVDAQRMPDKDMLLPAGNLREARVVMRDADLIILHKIVPDEPYQQKMSRLDTYDVPLGAVIPVFDTPLGFDGIAIEKSELKSRAIMPISGLGNNLFFHSMLTNEGYNIHNPKAFRDHHAFSPKEIEKILQELAAYKGEIELSVVTTEKDYVRLKEYATSDFPELQNWIYFPLKLEWIEGGEKLDLLLDSLIYPCIQS